MTMPKQKSKRPDGAEKLPPNTRKMPIKRQTYAEILALLNEQQQAAIVHASKSAEARAIAQAVATERGMGPIALVGVRDVDGQPTLLYVSAKRGFVPPTKRRRR